MPQAHRQYYSIKSIHPAPMRGYVIDVDDSDASFPVRRIPIVSVAVVEVTELVSESQKGSLFDTHLGNPNLNALEKEGWTFRSRTEQFEPVVLLDGYSFPWPRLGLAVEDYSPGTDRNPVVWCDWPIKQDDDRLADAETMCRLAAQSARKLHSKL
jgi:hypothetical protein